MLICNFSSEKNKEYSLTDKKKEGKKHGSRV